MKIQYIVKFSKIKDVVEDAFEWDGAMDEDMVSFRKGFWYKMTGIVPGNDDYHMYADLDSGLINKEDISILEAIEILRDKRIKEILE